LDQIVRAVEPDYETVRAMLDALKRRFPHARLGVCGRSLGGRSIYTLSIGPQENPVLYTGGFHGQEWLTPLLLLRFFERQRPYGRGTTFPLSRFRMRCMAGA